MIPLVAALVVSKPAVEVTALVPVVETIVSSVLLVLDMFSCCPPHVGVALQGREPFPSSLVIDLLLQLVTVPEVPSSVGGGHLEGVGRHDGGLGGLGGNGGGERDYLEWEGLVVERLMRGWWRRSGDRSGE